MSGQEDYLLARLHHALLNAPRKNVADILNFVDSRGGHSHRRADWPLGHAAQLVKYIINGVEVDLLTAVFHVRTSPPTHVRQFLQQVSPIHPEMGTTGVFFSMDSFFQPTFAKMLFISSEISSLRSFM